MKLFVQCFFLLAFLSCVQKEKEDANDAYFSKKTKENIQLKLNKISTITLENHKNGSIGAPLYNIEFDTFGNMYFFDTIESKFIIYDSKGKFLKTFGRAGRGPLEFELVYAYTLDELNNLYVYDDALRGIKIVNDSLNLTSIYKIKNKEYYITSHDIEVVGKNIYVGILGAGAVATTDNSQELIDSPLIMIAEVDNQNDELKNRYIGTYDPYLKQIESYYYRPIFYIDREKQTILVSHQNSYRFQEFDLRTGSLIKYFGFKSDNYGEGEKKSSKNRNRKENYLNSLSESNNELVFSTDEYIGNFYLNGTEEWFDSKDLSDLHYYFSIYSKENYTYITTLEANHRLIKVQNNKFYFIEDEDPEEFKIGIYELIEI
jgi:hypothetical protein